jgi:hypothetical protein
MRDYMNPDFAVGMTKKKKEVRGEIRDCGLLNPRAVSTSCLTKVWT